MIKLKKGQIAGQIFIYVIAIVITSLIIVYGYSAIKDFRARGDQVEYISMKTTLENTFKSIVSDFGSIKRPDISVPSKYKQVCFVNLQINSPGAIASQEICTDSDNSLNYEPLVCAGWKTGRDNLYLLPDGSDAFNVGPITIKGKNWHCFRVVNSKIKMQMKSLGDKVELCDYTPTETSKTKC